MNKNIILASSSPRRSEILQLMDIKFQIVPSDYEENINNDVPPEQAVQILAKNKANQVWEKYPKSIVIGADTAVVIDNMIFGKPKSQEHAVEMLQRLSGKTHVVHTGVWISSENKKEGFTDSTKVSFCNLTRQDVLDYVLTGEPMDKAGAYGIQGRGMRFIESISGDFYTVMGLPSSKLWKFIQSFY